MQLFGRYAKCITFNAQREIFLRYVNQMFDALACGKKNFCRTLLKKKAYLDCYHYLQFVDGPDY